MIAGVLAAVALLGGGTAIATREDGPPAGDAPDRLPAALRDGAVLPDRTGGAVVVADGTRDGVRWRLSASTCDYGARRAVGVFLTVPGGGGGARCDVAAQLPGADPATIVQRRVFAYYDPQLGRTWVFGAVPARASAVAVAGATVPTRAAARLDGLRVFLTSLPGARGVPSVVARDGAGRVVERCVAARCPTPIPGAR